VEELFNLSCPELRFSTISSVILAMLERPLPPDMASRIEFDKGEIISSLPGLTPLDDRMEAPVILGAGEEISTDEILPAGARVLPDRINIPKLAEFTFDQIDETYPTSAAETRGLSGHIVVAGANYGHGSSRLSLGMRRTKAQ
jgi:aconitate hydratase